MLPDVKMQNEKELAMAHSINNGSSKDPDRMIGGEVDSIYKKSGISSTLNPREKLSSTSNNVRVLSTNNYNLRIESNEENLEKNVVTTKVKRNASKVQFAKTPNCDLNAARKSASRERDLNKC